ncbi:hypothetical protein [Bianquea renquensis]|jgi:hypothetical protein|uniref:hypothetical protein n=1 Tax=Bianquea renquensis TaxID=2763661 RepID=UPI003A255413
MPLLDDMSNTGIWIMTATAKEIYEDERTLLISAKAENNSKLALWTARFRRLNGRYCVFQQTQDLLSISHMLFYQRPFLGPVFFNQPISDILIVEGEKPLYNQPETR